MTITFHSQISGEHTGGKERVPSPPYPLIVKIFFMKIILPYLLHSSFNISSRWSWRDWAFQGLWLISRNSQICFRYTMQYWKSHRESFGICFCAFVTWKIMENYMLSWYIILNECEKFLCAFSTKKQKKTIFRYIFRCVPPSSVSFWSESSDISLIRVADLFKNCSEPFLKIKVCYKNAFNY